MKKLRELKWLSLVMVLGLLALVSVFVLTGLFAEQAQAASWSGEPVEWAAAAVPPAQTCTCSADALNCSDFADGESAQACFDQCLSSAGYDVHDIDLDGDGLACEEPDSGGTQSVSQPEPTPTSESKVCDCLTKNLTCEDFDGQADAQSCFNKCRSFSGRDFYGLDLNGDGVACEPDDLPLAVPPPVSEPEAASSEAPDSPPEVPGADNLVANGNFEFGFYQVPRLGFEPPDVGNVPIDWDWFMSQTYGKVNIYNNEGFGIVCRDDVGLAAARNTPAEDNSPFGPIPGVPNTIGRPNNSVSLHLQSTDQQDMRLGIFQTVNVVPGQDYRFTMSGTIQTQSGATTLQPNDPESPLEDQNHTIELSFDQTGGENWKSVPLERRRIVRMKEQKLEFKVSETDEDIATIQSVFTDVRARSDKMTIFITAWRKWANWRTTIFTIDCISLVPIDNVPGTPSTEVRLHPTLADDEAVQPAAATGSDGAARSQPAVAVQPSGAQPPSAAPAVERQTQNIIPPSGGILEKAGSAPLIIGASVLVLLGLVGAGVWNMRR